MIKYKYTFLLLLFLFSACNSAPTYRPSDPSNGSDGEDSSSVSSVKPIPINFPEVDFNDLAKIKKHKRSKVILQRLADLIDATPKGASIYMSIFGFNARDESLVISAIKRADIRGVDLRIMLDRSDHTSNPTGEKNTNVLIKLKAIDKNIDIVGIYNDASPQAPTMAINHNKFALFSKVKTKNGVVQNIVFTGSENWGPNGEKNINNVVILSHKGLYGAYLGYWQAMKKRAASGMINYTFRKYSNPNDGIWAYFFPKRKNGEYYGPDPIIKILDGITDPASTTIQIVMPFWTNGRRSIAEKLSDLMNKGAKVEVVVRSNVVSEVHDNLVALAKRGAFVKMYNYNKTQHPDIKQIKLHSKVMLIQGEWHGKKTKLVRTGSQNFTGRAMRASNNNTLLLSSYHFKHPKLFQRFEDHFNEIKTLPSVCCMENNK
jgi:phosphatidylserine/phosphatidylglycerophosphate/cardiolipin synthase-like enzyme